MKLNRLDVVMPTFNEGHHVAGSVAAAQAAAAQAGISLRVIVVDDGSDAPSALLLDELADAGQIELIRQANSGRFLARAAGLAATTTDCVLLLDSRVELAPDSLALIRQRVEHEDALVWNYHVRLANPESVWASFWFGLTAVWWREYFRRPHRARLDEQNFDRYPKGTGAFLAPRAALLAATEQFDASTAENSALVSDDTRLLRYLAETEAINIDPQIWCHYWGKDTAKKWAAQCYYRGTTFVDGYLDDPAKAAMLHRFALGAIAVGVFSLVKWPMATLSAAAVASAGAALVTARCGGKAREAASVGLLAVPFGAIFGAGILRGLRLAARSRAR